MALSAKNKLCLINGSMTKLSDSSPDFKAWMRCNYMVLSWIINSVSKEISASIIYISSAEAIWKDLKEQFSQPDISSSCNFTSAPTLFSAHVKSISTDLWHYRLCHFSPSRLKILHSNNPQISCDLLSLPCTVCPLARNKRLHFPHSVTSSISIFDRIHCDIWGPYSVSSRASHHYFLTIVDDYSRYTWIHLMKSKDQTKTDIQAFFYFIETQFSSKNKVL
jgi:hypothetical protein